MEEGAKVEQQAISSNADTDLIKKSSPKKDSYQAAPDQKSLSNDTFDGPLKGKSNLRENRDMSEGL